MVTLRFTGHRLKTYNDIRVEAEGTKGEKVMVRYSQEVLRNYGEPSCQDKAFWKYKAGKLETDGSVRVTISDFR